MNVMFHVSIPRSMIANARRWALARGLVRTNDVHGLEEYKIPTFEGFTFSNEAVQSSRVKGSFEVEDFHGGIPRSSVHIVIALETKS